MRTRAIVDLGAICKNYEHLKRIVGEPTVLMCVVKADAYGHGAVAVSRALAGAGARHFAVATLEEAVQLRTAGLSGTLGVLGGLEPGDECEAVARGIYPMVSSQEQLESWNETAGRLGRRLPCQLMLNTGLNRLGLDFVPGNGSGPLALLDKLRECAALDVVGVGTHYASPENLDSDQTERQNELFQRQLRALREAGLAPRYVHSCSSAAIIHRAGDAWLRRNCTMARPGLALYGFVLNAVGRGAGKASGLVPALEWRARLAAVHDLPRGTAVGYAASFVAPRPMRVGTLAVGFADGLDRRLSNRGEVLLGGARCPIVGAISMDLTIIDLSAAMSARVGDEAVLLGAAPFDAGTVSDRIGAVPYEVLCRITQRVPRQYTGAPSGR
ncbi:MAG: alanine racemase [Bryobacterales bacterium]|nr:alanine racemase [Bryobacterales bacterium]MDE0620818.1 alanine racemase [Bryobacterales bacterium]